MDGRFIWQNIKSEVEFLKKYPTLLHATSDSESCIPGYLFGEINALTYMNDGANCDQLVAYFISRAQVDSHNIKFKALKMLLHLAKNGHKIVLEELKLNEMNLKEIAASGKPSQDFHEKTCYESIRKMAKELLTIVFSENSPEHSPEISFKGSATGHGSQATTNKLSGFGNTPNTRKNFSERMAEGFTDLVDKILSPTNEDDFYKKQAAVLNDSLPQYQPVTIEKSSSLNTCVQEMLTSESVKVSVKTKSTPTPKRPVHIAGRAGGGWEDSDDEIEQVAVISLEDASVLSISADSLENKKELPAVVGYVEEQNVIDIFAIDAPLEHLKYEDIASLCKRCSSLNCDKILEFLLVKLKENKENVTLRCLVIIEYLLHHDIVNLESLIRITLPTLKQTSESAKGPVQMKSKKICLIVDCLNRKGNKTNV